VVSGGGPVCLGGWVSGRCVGRRLLSRERRALTRRPALQLRSTVRRTVFLGGVSVLRCRGAVGKCFSHRVCRLRPRCRVVHLVVDLSGKAVDAATQTSLLASAKGPVMEGERSSDAASVWLCGSGFGRERGGLVFGAASCRNVVQIG